MYVREYRSYPTDITLFLPAAVCVHSKVSQQNARLCQALHAILKADPFGFYSGIFMQEELGFLLGLKYLQHLPLQLDAGFLQHLEADHKRDLVS